MALPSQARLSLSPDQPLKPRTPSGGFTTTRESKTFHRVQAHFHGFPLDKCFSLSRHTTTPTKCCKLRLRCSTLLRTSYTRLKEPAYVPSAVIILSKGSAGASLMLASSCPVLLQSLGTVALFFFSSLFYFQGSSLHLHRNVAGAISDLNAQLNPAVPLGKLSSPASHRHTWVSTHLARFLLSHPPHSLALLPWRKPALCQG